MYMHLLYPYISERIHKVFGKVPAAPSRPPVFGYKKGEWAREKEGNGRGKGDKGEWVRGGGKGLYIVQCARVGGGEVQRE